MNVEIETRLKILEGQKLSCVYYYPQHHEFIIEFIDVSDGAKKL
ncbi:MAG: hypothetical protein Q6363_004115 [Candidatus Njordarchaeota archaeon]